MERSYGTHGKPPSKLRGSSGASAADDQDEMAVDALLRRQLEYVRQHSPFYQGILRRRNGRTTLGLSDLGQLPYTTREQLQEDQARHPPFGSYLAVDKTRVTRVHRTSGSTGRPLIITLSASEIEDTVNCGARCFSAAGVGPDDLIVHCLSYCMWSGGVTDHQALERAGAAVIPYGVGNTSQLLRTILDVKPTGIHCTPSYLAKLEQHLNEEFDLAPSALGLKLGLFGGEPGLQDRHFRARIEHDWGFRAMDANYGMAEVLSMFGAECQVREGLHFMGQGVVYPELKHPTGDELLPWEPGVRGELVLTHLRRECQPLVRYRTSDLIEVVACGPCECGRPTPRWRVVGRLDNMVVIRGVNVYLSSIGEVIHGELDRLTGEYRVLVNRTQPITDFVIKVEVKPGRQQHNLAHELEDRLMRELGVRVCVTLVPQGHLPRTGEKTRRLERVL
ncbi:MAG: AMP-binding protein [Phycisphaerae bacterium]|nr:AMP-binding protein [Phycisphaerae bacterium]